MEKDWETLLKIRDTLWDQQWFIFTTPQVPFLGFWLPGEPVVLDQKNRLPWQASWALIALLSTPIWSWPGAGHTLELSLPLSVSNVSARSEQKANKGWGKMLHPQSLIWIFSFICPGFLGKLTVAYSRNTSFQRQHKSQYPGPNQMTEQRATYTPTAF